MQYSLYTVSVTKGSNIVTGGTGTKFLTNVKAGNAFKVKNDPNIYQVAAVNSDTEIALTSPYLGATAYNVQYQITTDYTPNFGLAEINIGDQDWPVHLTVETIRKIDSILGGISTGLTFIGSWDAGTNLPNIPAASPSNLGWIYKVVNTGTTTIDGNSIWAVGDSLISNGSIWVRVPAPEQDIAELVGTAIDSATSASTSATSALDSKNSALASAASALESKSAAAVSEANAVGAADSLSAALAAFRRTFIGYSATDPVVDGNGGPLLDGATYVNTITDKIRVYSIETGTWADYDAAAQAATNSATLSAANAAASALNAEASAVLAGIKATEAGSSASAASVSASEALSSAQNALNSKTITIAAASTATTAASAALVSEQNALASKQAAALSESNALSHAAASASSQAAALLSKQAAAVSANEALSSEQLSNGYKLDAAASASSASSSAGIATTAADNASISAASAAASANTATLKADDASINAANAFISASAAAASATTAENFANTIEGRVIDAETAASAAAASAVEASGYAADALSSKNTAGTSRDQAVQSLNTFNTLFLGAKIFDPVVDNNGNPLLNGTLYYFVDANPVNNVMKVYNGTVWVAAYASLEGAMTSINNLSDVANPDISRQNIGAASPTEVLALSIALG